MIYYPAPAEKHAVTRIAANMGIDVVPELYFDLSYDDEGGLVLKRANEGADLDDTKQRLARFLEHGEVVSVNGKTVAMTARSICLHGDGPNAVDLARAISEAMHVRYGGCVLTFRADLGQSVDGGVAVADQCIYQ